MGGWQWFWMLVGYLAYIIVLSFLFVYPPFEDLFTLIVYGITFDNIIFWVALITGIVGFCAYHYRAYRQLIVQQGNVDSMVLASLKGSVFVAILLAGGATLQSVQSLCLGLLRDGYALESGFARHLGAIVALVILTGVFCIIFWLLKVVRGSRHERQGG
jgi:hypothetical protein